ncbi:11340_t:CDS:2 [Ambispora gerdemannii]|uniref:11340_t:CDS:1 n=1 Tax=Ambispora gerdemannii TaxID=144530 RepID=A0A9N9CTD2_9GLOM|nr:11340_t:CDS:2 [Ambispora gerdemannii]
MSPEESQEHISDITRIEINYLDMGDFVEHEIRDLTAGANIDGIADIAYKTHLLVQLDIAITQNKTAKEMADLVIAEVEGGDDYSWNGLKKSPMTSRIRYLKVLFQAHLLLEVYSRPEVIPTL